ncbi:MAG: ribose 5-phosphate isomerase B [Syntrophaceticus sp.]|nr:ribose 5-phosphate isomerase B [Syntrophaceticus sp.]MDD3314289.1 ribose 5-phosphate isomerase B [Syntrophaceticus sp.]MDD4359099.1 ribose 5-phosphate isomerase B [Syntrophaceticus sp.]MDD4782332.1 ribose 5-phosphate isomerase B [Syntrophaceticus sp.]
MQRGVVVGVEGVSIAIGCDHAGLNLKKSIIEHFQDKGAIFTDFGVETAQSVDYPDIALVVAESVAGGESSYGILVCGTGIGMVMAANKVPGIRAALCHDTFTARAAREHNDANVLTLGERVTGPGLACEIVETWLDASFQGGRHEKRIAKIKAIEEKYCHCSKL